jgi:hypothetical protein
MSHHCSGPDWGFLGDWFVKILLMTVILGAWHLDNTPSSERQAAFMSALVTEHSVLQTAASGPSD